MGHMYTDRTGALAHTSIRASPAGCAPDPPRQYNISGTRPAPCRRPPAAGRTSRPATCSPPTYPRCGRIRPGPARPDPQAAPGDRDCPRAPRAGAVQDHLPSRAWQAALGAFHSTQIPARLCSVAGGRIRPFCVAARAGHRTWPKCNTGGAPASGPVRASLCRAPAPP